jgi:hypothetical protein
MGLFDKKKSGRIKSRQPKNARPRAPRVQENVIPEYNTGPKKRRKIEIPTGLAVSLAALSFALSVLYLPPAIIGEVDARYASKPVPYYETALKTAIDYIKNNPNGDFDGDRFLNDEETSYKTGVYTVDSDGDGTTDWAELYVTETNPTVYDDAITDKVKATDAAAGNGVNSPFKIRDVILWPDDYRSRATGAVIKLSDTTYRFCEFSGWVKFPAGKYAYKEEVGVKSRLTGNDDGAFYVKAESSLTVHVLEAPLVTKYLLNVIFVGEISIEDGLFGKVLETVLPSKGQGLLTCREATEGDSYGKLPSAPVSTAEIAVFESIPLHDDRFSRSMTLMSDLAKIEETIDASKCVPVSLMSHDRGEAILIVYGYIKNRALLAATPMGEKVGALTITPMARRLLDYTGEIQQYEYYAFSGCGFDSAKRHRIAILEAEE